ncbi:MAG: DUF4265 domain-containing protein [Neisseria sp.]|uniref:DUF4265 domain-containing protein n=1 Tax=Neisseria sp. TaxID=192066 RepID=UPI0026DD53AD|nr:DUF4265 domain-containing protein [Neisseria sp.]MDO4641905.1 DUF4265 domain-containing protein [Neisseria sp.]
MKKKLTVFYYDLEGNIEKERLSGDLLLDNKFVIREIPLFVPNLALNDIVEVEEDEGHLFFADLVKASGNITIHIVLLKNSFENLFSIIRENRGTIRRFGESYLAVNFTLLDDYMKTKSILDFYELKNVISYKESCLG